MTAGYLDRIIERTIERVGGDKKQRGIGDLEREAALVPSVRPFGDAVAREVIGVIAEIKRRSPSAGEISGEVSVEEQAHAYSDGGAVALSVLTEPHFFDGTLEDLKVARDECDLPVLRKDFIVDTYQVVESKAAGADAILLIVAALQDQARLVDLAAAAREWGVPAMFEIHDEWEIERAFDAGPQIIGINQRNLTSFEVQDGLAIKLRPAIPSEVLVVAESGFSTRKQIEDAEAAGVDAVLVGEALMRANDPKAKLRELLGPGE